jgi:serine/threonine protein kinase
MDALQWRRLKDAFILLHESEPTERNELLATFQREDPAFASELESLLVADATVTDKDWWPVGREAGRADDFHGNERFTLEKRIGSGAFGVVYSAFDNQEQRTIALKVLRVHESDALLHFKREFRAVSDLRHPHLVGVHELFIEKRHAYFTMDLVEGTPITESLSATRGSGENSPDFAESIRDAFLQLSKGLVALHRAGIIHRDLKPSNVLRTASGRVVILDFGMVTTTAHRLTNHHGGTPAYMAPEQLDGNPASEASDWYAVGLMLFECLVGRLPAQDSTTAIQRRTPTTRRLWNDVTEFNRDGRAQTDLRSHSSQSWTRPSAFVANVPETFDLLCQTLLDPHPQNRPTPTRAIALLTPSVSIGSGPVSTRSVGVQLLPHRCPLFGRKPQLETLLACFDRVSLGRIVAVQVMGRSGMGKSALVNEFVDRLQTEHADLVVLHGRCHERETLGYRVFDGIVDDLADYASRLDADELRPLIPANSSDLVALFPALTTLVVRAGCVPSDEYETAPATAPRLRAYVAFRELLRRLASRKKVLVFIDDLQWGDEDSARLFRYLLRRSSDLPFMLVVAYRTEDLDSERLRGVVAEFAAVEDTSIIPVTELQSEDAKCFVEYQLGAFHPLIKHVVESQEGAPFLLNLIVDEARSISLGSNPRSNLSLDCDALITHSLSRLSPTARLFMALLAVAARPLRREVLYRALGLPRAVARETEDTLRLRRMVRTVHEEMLEVFHDRLRTALHVSLSTEERQRLHAALAQALIDSADPETLAYHYRCAQNVKLALEYSLMSARVCAKVFAFDRAVSHYRYVLGLGVIDGILEGQIYAELAEVLVDSGNGREASTCFIRAAERLDSRSVELRLAAGQQLIHAGESVAGRQLLFDVLKTVGVAVSRRPLRLSLAFLYYRLKLRRTALPAIVHTRSTDSRNRAILDTLWALGSSLALVDTIGSAFFETYHLIFAIRNGDAFALARALSLEAVYASIEGERGEVRTERLLKTVERACDAFEQPTTLALLKLSKSIVAWMKGDFENCLIEATAAEELLLRHGRGHSFEFATIRAFALASQIWLGKLHEHAARFESLLDDANLRADLHAQTSLVLLAHAHVHWLARDEWQRAEVEVKTTLERWPIRHSFALQHVWALFSLVEVALYRCDTECALKLLESRWSQVRHSTHLRLAPIGIWLHQLRARVMLTAIASRPNDRTRSRHLRVVRREVAWLMRRKIPLGRGLAALTSGLLALAKNQTEVARSELTQAERHFDALGMQLHFIAARWALAGLIPETTTISRSKLEETLRALGVVKPQNLMEMLVPGTTLDARYVAPDATS